MAHITTCPKCGHAYEETCEELANAPDRQCDACFDRMIDDCDEDEPDLEDMTEDERLDDPRHGQARDINKVIR